ncbi:MAG: PKD domain-containing protein [Vicinamibacterales bacterium]
MYSRLSSTYVVRLAALVCVAVAAAGCTIDKQGAPSLTGPSEFAQSVTLKATPDRLVQDGQSLSTVTAQLKGPDGVPRAGVVVQFVARASDGTEITLTGASGMTDAAGNVTTGVIAPSAPQFQPSTPVTISVQATPVGLEFADAGAATRQVTLTLVPPAGTPPPNGLPVAEFTFLPAAPTPGVTVTFDASTSTDEGVSCNTACSYAWTFGDGTTGTGLFATRAYSSSGTYTVTLTVTDARGGVSKAKAKPVTVGLPTAPAAGTITFSPTPVAVNAVTNFDAGGATVGLGASIVSYTWTWGDGVSETTTGPQAQHAFGAAGVYTVRVTVLDSLGRTATATVSVTVV